MNGKKDTSLLNTFLGQRDAIAPLLVAIASSEATGRALPHMLFLGGPGRGKTTLARAVANDTGKPLAILHGSSTIERQIISQKIMEAKGGVLFIDEIHALPRQISEELYRVMDEGKLSISVPVTKTAYHTQTEWFDDINLLPENMKWAWQGPFYYTVDVAIEKPTNQTETKLVDVSPITIMGATTDEALLPEPFYSRLSSLIVRLRAYDNGELADIAQAHAETFGVWLEPMTALEVAKRSRSTPRKVKQLVERMVDWAIGVKGERVILWETAEAVLNSMGVDDYGLSKPHRDLLQILKDAPGGLSRTSLAQQLRIPPRNVEMYWADLAEAGFVSIDTRHRITEKGTKAYA